jgi:hypothetical protein
MVTQLETVATAATATVTDAAEAITTAVANATTAAATAVADAAPTATAAVVGATAVAHRSWSSIDWKDPMTVGVTVGAIVLIHLYLLQADDTTLRDNATSYSRSLLLLYGVAAGVLVQSSDEWLSFSSQLTVAGLIALLDWFAMYQSPYRFSEAEVCLGGSNCRLFSIAAGIAAHTADSLGVASIPFFATEDTRQRALVATGTLVYWMAGVRLVSNTMGDGSVSDMRGLDDTAKCKRARGLMPNRWRGALNDVVLALDMVLMWQAILTCADGRCVQASGATGMAAAYVRPTTYSVMVFRVLLIFVPMYADFIGSSVQHNFAAAGVDLPPCFDD